MLKRSDFVVTNILKIKKHSDIIANDLTEEINTKYSFLYVHKKNIKHTVKTVSTNKENFIDGFDICFDIIGMK